jgi:hypothetical protein
MLRLIGYWHGEGEDAEWPDPSRFVQPGWESEEKARIVDYLRSGARLHEDLGYSHCRFPGGPPDEDMGNAELSDGVWIWPEGLWIYVDHYDVILPDELVRHMRRNSFQKESHLDEAFLESVSVELDFGESGAVAGWAFPGQPGGNLWRTLLHSISG